MSMKRLSTMMVTSLAMGLSACGGAVQTETGPAGTTSGALSTSGAIAPAAPLDKSLSAPSQLTMPLAPTPMPKAALPAKVGAAAAVAPAATNAGTAPSAVTPSVAAPAAVEEAAIPAVSGDAAPVAAGSAIADARVAAIALDSKYLTADERLKLVGLAVETVCLGFSFDQTEHPRVIAQLHASSGIDAKTFDRHLPSLFAETATSEAVGRTRLLCSESTAPPEAVALSDADRPLLETLLGVTLGVGKAKAAVVDDAVYNRVVELLRTREDFRKAFVREAAAAIEALAESNEPVPTTEAVQPGGPSEAQLPQIGAEDPPADGGCTSDKDCKGDRICVDGKCVNPPSGDAPPGDTPPADPNEPAPDPSKPVSETLRFSGSLSGSGTVSFRIKGRTITGASASVQGINFSLKSSGIDGKGGFQLIGNNGGNYVRIRATYSAGKKWAKGSFEGTINKRKISGSVTASAR